MRFTKFPFLAGVSLLATLSAIAVGCQSAGKPASRNGVTPVYNKQNGVLEQLVADRQGDGRIDMRARMTGTRVDSVEIDRNRDGQPDRWEYYEQAVGQSGAGARTILARAEEANGTDAKVTRWEFYDHGVISRIQEDTDADGRVDKWEVYERGALVRMDLDLAGRGFPDRRLVYRPDGSLDHTENDAAGDGHLKEADPGAAKPAAGIGRE